MGSPGTSSGEATARAGLAGNPSDALGGAALAVPIPAMRAEVRLRSADRLRIRGPHDEGVWSTMDALDRHASRFGHEGADRLVTAALVTLWRFARTRDLSPAADPFEVDWATNIPRSVGLSGSSALVIATLRAAAGRWQIDLAPDVVASLALDTERIELGLAAGWMDRAVQAYESPVLIDAREMSVTASGVDIASITVVRPVRPVELIVAWDPRGSAPSGRLHASLRARLDEREPEMLAVIDGLVTSAYEAAEALRTDDLEALAASVDGSCELRRRLGALDDATANLVDIARALGAAATSAGSGGAVTVVTTPARIAAVAEGFADHGLAAIVVEVAAGRGEGPQVTRSR